MLGLSPKDFIFILNDNMRTLVGKDNWNKNLELADPAYLEQLDLLDNVIDDNTETQRVLAVAALNASLNTGVEQVTYHQLNKILNIKSDVFADLIMRGGTENLQNQNLFKTIYRLSQIEDQPADLALEAVLTWTKLLETETLSEFTKDISTMVENEKVSTLGFKVHTLVGGRGGKFKWI